MGNRYKRMVTLGMISFTALLAWGYCMLAYRSQAVYVAIISLVLVGSIYALLLSVVDIKVAKEQAMQEYVTKTLQEYTKKEDTEILNDMERLAKASYVQQRKTNSTAGGADAEGTGNAGSIAGTEGAGSYCTGAGGVWQAGRRCTGSGCPVTAGDSPAYCIA